MTGGKDGFLILFPFDKSCDSELGLLFTNIGIDFKIPGRARLSCKIFLLNDKKPCKYFHFRTSDLERLICALKAGWGGDKIEKKKRVNSAYSKRSGKTLFVKPPDPSKQ